MYFGKSSALRGYVFEFELLNMIRKHKEFSNINHEVLDKAGYLMADIMTDYHGETLFIECKGATTFSLGRFEELLKKLEKIQGDSKNKRVLAFPGELTSLQQAKINNYNWLIVWDLNIIAAVFSQQIKDIQSIELRELLLSAKSSDTIEDKLLKELKTCNMGKSSWSTYQKICTNLFEHLFSPKLGKPFIEHSDSLKANRRDIIMANYCDSGFWGFMVSRYKADFIVVDAKNYSSRIDKTSVLQMANYLKEYGPGLFGIISSRTIPKESAVHTQREVWMAQSKLIIFINDLDYEQMLLLKKNGNDPEEVIKQKIEDFRLGL